MRKVLRLILPVLLLLLGIWLLRSPGSPAPESAQRQAALRSFTGTGSNSTAAPDTPPPLQIAEPVTVNLSHIPAGVPDPNNQYDRWLRGDLDLDETDTIRSAAEVAALRQAARALPPMSPQRLSANRTLRQVPAAATAFDSIDFLECCGTGGAVPPDPEIAVGPDHVIAVVNVALEIYDKDGSTLLGPTTFASFMADDPNCINLFDPNAIYDEEADRYILGVDANGTHYCLAVSQTANPTGAWNVYSFVTGSDTLFFDYPHAGVGQDAIYMGANIFASSFLDSRIWAFDKWAMYQGNPTTAVMKNLGANDDTPQPLHLTGWRQGTWPAGGPHYFFTETGYNGADHTVWAWSDPFGDNQLTAVGTIDLNAATGVTAGIPLSVPQKGGANIRGNDFRPQDFEYRNGFAWTTMTIACNPGGGTVNCVRWAQIDPATATVAQAGVLSGDDEYRIFPDLAVNHCDDMAVGYTKSSSNTFPAVWYTGREGSDPPGTLQTESRLKAGEMTYTAFDPVPHRWGDYTEMRVDPDGVTLWYLGQYSKNTGTSSGRWGTYVGAIDFGSCIAPNEEYPNPPPTASPTATAVPPSPTPTATPMPNNDTYLYLPLIFNQ